MENYCNEQLFYSNNHPNEKLMLLYPSVAKTLGLKRYEKKFYPNRYY